MFLSLGASARPQIWVLMLCSLQEQAAELLLCRGVQRGAGAVPVGAWLLGCCLLRRGGWAAVGMLGM